MAIIILIVFLGVPTYFIWKMIRKKANIIREQEKTDAEIIRICEEATGEKWSELESTSDDYDIFNDPYVETEAKNNRNNPDVITFVYEKIDGDGFIINEERAINPYHINDEYLEGFCLDKNGSRTFRIDKIIRFTGNSRAVFDELD